MNRIFKFILPAFFLLSVPLVATAQALDPEAYPWVRIANATGLEGPIQVFVKGRNLNPQGYESGYVTGAFSLFTGPTEFEIKHPLIESTKFTLDLSPSDRMAVVLYTEALGNADAVSQKRVLRHTTLKRKARGEKKSATLLFISPNKGIELGMNDTALSLTANQVKDIQFGKSRGSSVQLTVKGRPLKNFDIDEPGDYAIIVFDKPDGTQGCITFNNTKI